MKITNNLLHNQNYTFSKKLYKQRLKEIADIKSDIKPSAIKGIIVFIFALFVSPFVAISLTHGISELLGILLWGLLGGGTLALNNMYENRPKRVEEKQKLGRLKNELEAQIWQHHGYVIYGKHNGWMRDPDIKNNPLQYV